MPTSLPALADVDMQARRLDLSASAAELHGLLCGWLSGGGSADSQWLAQVLADPQLPPVPADSALAILATATASQLEDRSFDFELLLPHDDSPLAARSGALFEWCRGFLGGFGLAAGHAPPLSEEGNEALADIARLAAATPQDDGDEEDETALSEIEEFVRVASLLIHGDCVMAPRHRQQFN